eukprot:5011210-Lingulodinium_polyedra.AAC.1
MDEPLDLAVLGDVDPGSFQGSPEEARASAATRREAIEMLVRYGVFQDATYEEVKTRGLKQIRA